MPTLRRILKYTPAVMLGLLLVTWVVSDFYFVRYGLPLGDAAYEIHVERSVVTLEESRIEHMIWATEPFVLSGESPEAHASHPLLLVRLAGSARTEVWDKGEWAIVVPLDLVATLTLPLAIGPFLSFRFRLWHYLAYTTLMAVELAYYLRWQE